MGILTGIFVWWRGATAGTWINTWINGRSVGTDAFGNRYYQDRTGKRRWVIYNGTVEASRVPAEWHGWLHYTFKEPPPIDPFKIKPWEKEHLPNLTGTDLAYHPPGSLARAAATPPATGDYEPWIPK